MGKQSLGARIAELLVAEGVDKFFSLPEVTFGKLHGALDALGVPLIAPHHETAGGYMAEAYSQITGQIGVVGAACGPGVMNLYPAIANSYMENLPILYLGSERTALARNSPRSSKFQCPPNIDVVKAITKYAAIVEDPLQADEIFHEAFRQLRTGTPGPVYIGLPFDMLLEEREFGAIVPPQRYRPATFLSTVADHDLETVADMLAGAKRPLIVGGSAIRNSRAKESFARLVETAQVPVILTFGGRGVLPDTHPQLFDMGVAPGLDIAREADVILVVGASIGEKMAFGGNPYSIDQKGFPNYFGNPDQQKWIHLEQDPAAIGRNRQVDMALVGNISTTLPRLADVIERRDIKGASSGQLSKWQDERSTYYAGLYAKTTDSKPIHPGRAIVEIQKSLPEDVVMVRDGGAFSVWQMNLMKHNISEHLKAIKQGNLGTGVPYAMGAALAVQRDGRRVCLVTGDGAFGFYAMEIETAVRYKLPIVIIVGYDAGWSLEVPYYMHLCGKTFEVDHNFMRLDDLARVMGAHGEFCETADEVAPAVARAFASGKPAIVQVVIDRQVNAYEMPNSHLWTRWHADKQVYTE